MPEERKRRRGPKPKAPDEARAHHVGVYLTDAEHKRLTEEAKAVKLRRGAVLRQAWLGQPARPIPELNREAWTELSRAASNLNQIAKALHEEVPDIENVRQSLDAFRRSLIGAKP